MMDVVYPYKARPFDLEIRYSLRSLVNVPHNRVIVAGDRPKIISGRVIHVPVPRIANRYKSSTANILAAAERAVETERFIVFHDDMFVLRPWVFRHEHRGTIEDYLASGRPQGLYRSYVEWTRDILNAHGVQDPLWFGLHTPTVYERQKLIDLIREFRGQRYLLRTLYHNLFPQPSTRRDDVKKRDWSENVRVKDVVSISDRCAWTPAFRRWIKARFPVPSPYES
jgi:hypothetical protein